MDWNDKIWGKTREVVYSPFYAKHELEVVAGGYCSLHYHLLRANRFHVGTAHIQVIMMYGPAVEKITLGPDNIYDVPSLVPHMFCVLRSGTVVEEYFPDRAGQVLRDDIVRIVEGGQLEVSELHKLPQSIIE
jgi:hypothetical protein